MTEKDLIIQDLRRENKELKKFICSMFKCEFCDFELGERCGLLNWLQMPAEDDE